MTLPRVVAVTVAGLIVGLVVAVAVVAATRPSDDQLQRAALEEMGLSPDLAESPLIGPLLDQLTEQVGDRVIAETRTSVLAGVLAGVVASGAVAALALTAMGRADRRHPTPTATWTDTST